MARPRTERLDARLTAAQDDTLEQAAALTGTTVSSFVVQAALDTAEDVLLRHQLLVLSERDSAALATALARPPALNEVLRRAADGYRQATAEA